MPVWLLSLPWGKIVKYAAIVAAVLFVLWVPYHYGCTTTSAKDAARIDKIQKEAADVALKAEQEQRKIEQARQTAVNEVQKNAQEQIAKHEAAVVAANTATRSLRDAYAAYVTSHAGSNSPTASGSAPASDVQSDVFGRVAEAANRFAAEADAARIAGQACEKSYDALH